MKFGMIVFESPGRYSDFYDNDEMYNFMKEVTSTEDGIKKYGMRFVAGKSGIPDEDIDKVSDGFSMVVNRLNSGERLDVKKELETIVSGVEIL